MVKALAVILLTLSIIGGLHAAPAGSAPKPQAVTIITPSNGETIRGGGFLFTVGFRSDAKHPVSKLQVFLDGNYVNELAFSAPQAQGNCSFKWDTLRTPNGKHKLDIRAFSDKVALGTASCEVNVSNQPGDLAMPRVALVSPRDGAVVSGITPVRVEASAASGEPMVSVMVDKSLRSVKNRSPYIYQWDTTRDKDGPHSIEVTAVDGANNKVGAKPVRVTVRNPVKAVPLAGNAEKPAMTTVEVPVPPADGSVPVTEIKRTSARESARTTSGAGESFEVVRALTSTGKAASPAGDAPRLVPDESPEPPAAEPSVPDGSVSGPGSGPMLVARLAETDLPGPTLRADYRLSTPSIPSPETSARAVEAPASGEYVVQPGDSVLRLAKRFGVPAKAIIEANSLEDPALIRIGDKLHIPVPAKLVWAKPVFEQAGGWVLWDQAARELHAVCPGNDVMLKIGESRATVNDRQVTMDHPAVVQSGRAMVSEQFITRTLGMEPGASDR